MKVRQLEIENFRGVRAGKVVFADTKQCVGLSTQAGLSAAVM